MPHKALSTLCRTPKRSTVFYLVTIRFVEVLGCLFVSLSTYIHYERSALCYPTPRMHDGICGMLFNRAGHNERIEILCVGFKLKKTTL